MGIRKLESPCKICKGKSKTKCLICGWKVEKKLKRDMTPMEIATEDGENNYAEWMDQTHSQLKKYQMDTTGVASVDDKVVEAKGRWKPDVVLCFYLYVLYDYDDDSRDWELVFENEKLSAVRHIQCTEYKYAEFQINSTGIKPIYVQGEDS